MSGKIVYLSILFNEGSAPSRVDFVPAVRAEFDPEIKIEVIFSLVYFLQVNIWILNRKIKFLLHDESKPEKEKNESAL